MHTIIGPTVVAAGSDITYIIDPQDGASYYWTVIGGTITSSNTGPAIIVHWTNPNNGQVQCNLNNGGEIIVIDTSSL